MSKQAKGWEALRSSNLAGVVYDESKRELEVEFRNTARYVLSGVKPEEYYGLVAARSPGGYFRSRLGGKRFRRL